MGYKGLALAAVVIGIILGGYQLFVAEPLTAPEPEPPTYITDTPTEVTPKPEPVLTEVSVCFVKRVDAPHRAVDFTCVVVREADVRFEICTGDDEIAFWQRLDEIFAELVDAQTEVAIYKAPPTVDPVYAAIMGKALDANAAMVSFRKHAKYELSNARLVDDVELLRMVTKAAAESH